MERYEDPNDVLNSAKYHTGQQCIERGCSNPAGTHWSRFWCQACNAKRMGRIGRTLQHEVDRMAGRVAEDSMPPDQVSGFESDVGKEVQ